MKNLITLYLIITSGLCYSQTIIPVEQYSNSTNNNNVYFKDVNNVFTKFLGTWEHSTENEYFNITFYKVIRQQESPLSTKLTQYKDLIFTNFIFRKKNSGSWNTIYDTSESDENNGIDNIYINGFRVKNGTTLRLFYTEPQLTGTCERQRYGNLTLTYSLNSSGLPQLQWIRENITLGFAPDEPCPDGTPRDASDFIIPATMVLTKVN